MLLEIIEIGLDSFCSLCRGFHVKYGNLGVSEFVYVSLGKILDDNINAQLQNCVSVLNEKKKHSLALTEVCFDKFSLKFI